MSTVTTQKPKLPNRSTKRGAEDAVVNINTLALSAQPAVAPPLAPIKVTAKAKTTSKKIVADDDAVSVNNLVEAAVGSAAANSQASAASAGELPLVYAQNTVTTSDASGAAITPIDLSANDTTSTEAAALASEDAGLSTGQIVALGILGAMAVGGATVAIVQGSKSNSNGNSNDTTPPTIQSLTADHSNQTITLTYNEALDPNHLPPTTSFTVTTGGAANTVSSVAVSGNTLILTLANAFISGATVSLSYTDPTTGNDSNAIQDLVGNDASGFIEGVVADGYIRGAKIYIDTNGDGIAQESEYTGVTTDANGIFFLPNSLPTGTLIAVGGFNIDTGLEQLTPLKAPAGSTTVNPLTSLLSSYLNKNPGISIDTASAAIAESLGISVPSGLSLSTFNPLASSSAAALAAQKVAAQIATMINLSASTDSTLANTIIATLAEKVGSRLDLSNSATISTILPSSISSSVVSRIAESNLSIKNTLQLSGIADIQKALGDIQIPGAPIITRLTDNVDDGITSIRVSLNGTGAKAGNVFELSDGANPLKSYDHELSDADISRSYFDLTLNLEKSTGTTYNLTGRIVDGSLLPGVVSSVLSFLNLETPLLTHNDTSLSSNTNFDYNEALIASLFANAAYDHRTKNAVDGFLIRNGWQKIGATELEVSNAYAFAAKRVAANGSVDYVISFEGSNSPFDSVQIKDWTVANASEYGWSKYYASLMPLMKDMLTSALADKKAGKDVEITITGHSLGGAAACVAYADLCLPSGNVWMEPGAPLAAGSRIYDLFSAADQADIRSILLPSINTYTFGAPSFLIEPTKFNNPEWVALGLGTAFTALTNGGMAAALKFLEAAAGVVAVDPSLLPDLTYYWQHVFQFEHKNSTLFTWDDPVANLGTYDAGTVINLDLKSDIYARYKGSWYNPIALHSIDYYGESIARLIEFDVLTKSGLQLLTSTSATSGNDFLLNTNGVNGSSGNDDYVYNQAGSYTATGGLGDDNYVIASYGIDLTVNGLSTDGGDAIYFALPGAINASVSGANVVFTIKNGASSSKVTVNDWANHYVSQVGQIEETTDPWRINYFNMNNIVESGGAISVTGPQELNGLTYTTDGYGLPFIMALPNASAPGSKISVPTPIIGTVEGKISFMVNGVFDPNLPTYVYTHGWTDNARVDETGSIKAKLIYDAYVTRYGTGGSKTANIVMANWESLAASRDPNEPTGEPSYESSITKQVGEVVADALLRAGADINKTTLVGHSLGSFVVGAAANEIVLRTGMKVKELVALDTAATNPFFPEYDIDARNGYDRSLIWGSSDTPYDFTDAIAQHTTSYTVIDNTLTGGLSGNNDRASTADSAYLVAYVPTDVPFLSMKATSPYHNGVVAAYADLIIKGDLNPVDANSELGSLKFNNDGQAVSNGIWEGVLAVNQPWLTSTQLNSDGNYIYNPPKSIGWISNIDNPTIYGSSIADVMFFDQFKTDSRVGATLNGGAGDDWLGGSTGQGIDHFIGGSGMDTFFFGYLKNTQYVLPYLDGASWLTDNGTDAFGIIDDFSLDDHITFGWNQSQMTLTDGASFKTKYFLGTPLSTLYGNGVAFSVNDDLVAYVKGITLAQAQTEITAHDILFSTYANLDQQMFFTTPAPVAMPTPVPVVI